MMLVISFSAFFWLSRGKGYRQVDGSSNFLKGDHGKNDRVFW
jgi:hypothetical protein